MDIDKEIMRDYISNSIDFAYRGLSVLQGYFVTLRYSSSLTLGSCSSLQKEASVVNLQRDKSRICLGSNSHVRGELLVFPYGGQIHVGDWCYIGAGTRIWSGESIVIGNHVGIAHNVNIVDCAHETNHLDRAEGVKQVLTQGHPREKGKIPTAPIVIEDHVAIYPNSVISRGVRLGEGAVISAGSVVLSDVAPFTLMVGNPARPLKKIDF